MSVNKLVEDTANDLLKNNLNDQNIFLHRAITHFTSFAINRR